MAKSNEQREESNEQQATNKQKVSPRLWIGLPE